MMAATSASGVPDLPELPEPPDWSVVTGNVWMVSEAPPGSARAIKHDLVRETKRLIEAIALLDPEIDRDSDRDVLSELVDNIRTLTDRVEGLPSLRARGGLASAGGDDATWMERSGISGRSNPLASPLHLWVDGPLTRAWAVWTDAYEGPPGCLHGGFVAAAFDDLLQLGRVDLVVGFKNDFATLFVHDVGDGVSALKLRRLHFNFADVRFAQSFQGRSRNLFS